MVDRKSADKRPTGIDRALVAMIADRVRRGDSLERIARTTRISYSRLRTLARTAGIRYKHQRPSQDQIKTAIAAVRDRGCTFRKAAELAQMSRTAVHRLISRMRQRVVDSAGDFKVIDGAVAYSKHKRSWRCAIHGRVTVWPCIACAAEAARRGTAQHRNAQ
jgi:predicted HTH domain antitoxin